jgi:hypothetical protein
VNGDGKIDLIGSKSGSDNQPGVLLGNGDGTFGNPVFIYGAGISDGLLLAGDFNGDHFTDVAIGRTPGGFPGGIQIALNKTADISPLSLGLSVASGSSQSATVVAGSTATYNLSIGGKGFTGTVSLACTGAPQSVTCTVPATQAVSGTTAASFSVTASTTARTSGAVVPLYRQNWMWAVALMGLVILPRAKRQRWQGRTRVIPLSLLLLLLVGCGGGSSGSGGGGHNSTGTPAGSYNLTITATVTVNAKTVTQTLPLTLIVQ